MLRYSLPKLNNFATVWLQLKFWKWPKDFAILDALIQASQEERDGPVSKLYWQKLGGDKLRTMGIILNVFFWSLSLSKVFSGLNCLY